MVAEGDRVAVRESYRGTHRGEFMGIPASGREVRFASIDIYRIADGKLVEAEGESDVISFMQQLGALPPFPPR
jgi:predicted ester cyclase